MRSAQWVDRGDRMEAAGKERVVDDVLVDGGRVRILFVDGTEIRATNRTMLKVVP